MLDIYREKFQSLLTLMEEESGQLFEIKVHIVVCNGELKILMMAHIYLNFCLILLLIAVKIEIA